MRNGCVIAPCSPFLRRKENKGFRTPQLARSVSPNLGCRFEIQRENSSNRSGMCVESVGFEPPLPDRVGCGAGKGQRTLQELGILHGAIVANQQLQNNCSLPTFCSFSGVGLVLLQNQSACCTIGQI